MQLFNERQGWIQKFLTGDAPREIGVQKNPSLIRVPVVNFLQGIILELCHANHAFLAISADESDVTEKWHFVYTLLYNCWWEGVYPLSPLIRH